MSNDLAKLNRLRVNAGKTELKSWKASQAKLDEAVGVLENAGFTDALPGANVNAAPIIEDPEIAKARPEPEEKDDAETPAKSDEPKTTKIKPHLARGLDTDGYAKHSRTAVAQHRERERKEQKEAKKRAKLDLSDADQAQIEDEAKSRKIAGRVDPKADPEKAKRQLDKVDAKRKDREEKNKAAGKNPANGRLKAPGDDEITVAEISRELDIDPKVARAKLRRHEDKLTKLHTKGQDRWTFPKTAKAEIVKILK